MKYLFALLLMPSLLMAQKKDKPAKSFELIQPKVSVQAGFGIPEFYNLGYELNANYYPYKKSWLRLGPAIQVNNFYIVNKEWFVTNNVEKSLSSEFRANALFNIDFIPLKKSSFYIGIAPYIGYQVLNNKGRVQNEAIEMDVKWNYTIHSFDYGLRYKLGGYFGKKQRYGMEGAMQMSTRGISDKNTLTKFFNVGMPTYKTYIAISFVYRIL